MRIARRALVLVAVGAAFGVTGVESQPAGQTWQLSSRPLVEVGAIDGPPEELFSRIAGAVRLDDGRFVVADEGELTLSVIDPSGNLETTFGARGEGPAEFRWIFGIWKGRGDTIAVWDPRIPRITRFLPDGEVVRTDRPSFGGGGATVPNGTLDVFLGAFRDGRFALGWLVPSRRAMGELLPDRMVFGLFDSHGRFERLLGEALGMFRIYTPAGGGPFAFSPFPWSAVVRDTLVYTNGLRGEILFFDPESAAQGAPSHPPACPRSDDRPIPGTGAVPRSDVRRRGGAALARGVRSLD